MGWNVAYPLWRQYDVCESMRNVRHVGYSMIDFLLSVETNIGSVCRVHTRSCKFGFAPPALKELRLSPHEVTRIAVAHLDFSILCTQEDFGRSHDLPDRLTEAREARSGRPCTSSLPQDGRLFSGRRSVGAPGRRSPFPAEVRTAAPLVPPGRLS